MRPHDWPERLHAFIEARRRSPFAWGSNDCCIFAADWVLGCTGVDHAAELRGYSDEKGALRRIRKAGSLRAFAQALKEKPPAFAQRGDVVLVLIEERETFGVVSGNGLYCAPGPDGLVFRTLREAVAAFEV